MKVGDVIINPYVCEKFRNGAPNPLHKLMVTHIGMKLTSTIGIDGKIREFFTKDCKDWKKSHHINIAVAILSQDAYYFCESII